jgi:hypothetical protein
MLQTLNICKQQRWLSGEISMEVHPKIFYRIYNCLDVTVTQCVPTMTMVTTVVQCAPTMRFLFPLLCNMTLVMQVAYHLEKTRQTDKDRPIRCSSLMLECEEHLKNRFRYSLPVLATTLISTLQGKGNVVSRHISCISHLSQILRAWVTQTIRIQVGASMHPGIQF